MEIRWFLRRYLFRFSCSTGDLPLQLAVFGVCSGGRDYRSNLETCAVSPQRICVQAWLHGRIQILGRQYLGLLELFVSLSVYAVSAVMRHT